MFNVLLDPLPQEWNGYKIDTSFEVGIMISQCLGDESLSQNERFFIAAGLLFPEEMPPVNEAAEAIHWWLTEFNHDNPKKGESKDIILDFDVDQWRIYAAFKSQYHIDLSTEKLHWFVFMGLLANISECALTHVMDIRNKKVTSRMCREEKKALTEAKKVFLIGAADRKKAGKYEELSATEQKAVDEFMQYVNISKGKNGGGAEG